MPRAEVDPLYFNAVYYVYRGSPIATEAYRVISAAMAEAGMVDLGRLALSPRQRMVLVEPRGAGLALIELRSAEEVRAGQFDDVAGEVDPEAVAIAEISSVAPDILIPPPSATGIKKRSVNSSRRR